jgi:hypothetical protein
LVNHRSAIDELGLSGEERGDIVCRSTPLVSLSHPSGNRKHNQHSAPQERDRQLVHPVAVPFAVRRESRRHNGEERLFGFTEGSSEAQVFTTIHLRVSHRPITNAGRPPTVKYAVD